MIRANCPSGRSRDHYAANDAKEHPITRHRPACATYKILVLMNEGRSDEIDPACRLISQEAGRDGARRAHRR
jgi:hypothetical protein